MAYKTINSTALLNNIDFLRNLLHKNTMLCAVVKDNAYGHNIKCIVPIIDTKVQYYAVNNIQEANDLLQYTTKPILVLGKYSLDEAQEINSSQIELCLDNPNDIEILKSYNKNINVHIAINSGMNRLGVNNEYELNNLTHKIQQTPNIHIKGVFSHISDAYHTKRTYKQHKNFTKITASLDKNIIKHISNTDTTLFYKDLNLDMVRCGIGIYGYGHNKLQPIMSVYAKIINVHSIKKGEYIGYDSEHKSQKNIKIAVLDIGYGDGLPRLYSNHGKVIINGKYCDIIANICMNMTIVDITNTTCNIGDTATIIGKQNNLSIQASDVATICHTIPYEILTNFSTLPTISV